MDRVAQFLQVYANLPAASRNEIMAVVDGEAYTWKSARIEIEQGTPLGAQILEAITSLGILPNEVH